MVIVQYFDKSIALLPMKSKVFLHHSKICSNPLNQSQAHRVHCGQPSNAMTHAQERERAREKEVE